MYKVIKSHALWLYNRRKISIIFILVLILLVFLRMNGKASATKELRAKASKNFDETVQKNHLETSELCSKNRICPSVNLLPTGLGETNSQFYECKFRLDTDIEYLPDAEFYQCIKKNKPLQWQQDKEKLFNRIEKLQNPVDCDHPMSNLDFEPTWKEGRDEHGYIIRVESGEMKRGPPKWALVNFLHHGYAYNLYVFSWLAGNYWTFKAPVILGNSKYRFSDIDCGLSWSCLWSPLSKCKFEQINPKSILVFHGPRASPLDALTVDQLCKPYGKYEYGRCNCNEGFMPHRNSSYSGCAPYTSLNLKVPRIQAHVDEWENKDPLMYEKIRKGDHHYFSTLAPGESNPHGNHNMLHYRKSWTRKKYGFLWEHAHWLYYLHKDAPLKPDLMKYLKDTGIGPEYPERRSIGIHVRHGDSCHDVYQHHRVCKPLSAYMKGVAMLEDKYGTFNVIYLATDDQRVISDSRLPEYQKYKFVYQKIDRSMYEFGDHNGVDIREEFNDPRVVLEIARDIWALAHCDAFIGSFASSVAWVAYELAVAINGHYIPFISIDLAYADKKNVGRFLDGPNE